MADVINNVTAPDNGPSVASTIDNVGPYSRVTIDVANAAIMWRVRTGHSPGTASWEPAAFMAPGSRTIYRPPAAIYGFEFWAAVAAAGLPAGQSQAQVTAQLV